MTKSGYVAIIGRPNVGKSTLLNSFVGAKLSIITPKPQTTRKKVIGIYTEGENQIVFIDTPGILAPKYEMQRKMMEYVTESLSDADIICLLVDVSDFEKGLNFPDKFLEALKNINKPILLALNKIDKLKNVKEVLPMIKHFSDLKLFTEIVPISAIKSAETSTLIRIVEKLLPENEFYYDEEFLSIQNERFFVSEIIREKVFKSFEQEIPYSTEINVVEFKEREFGKWFISAEIIIERSSQKRIVVGENGEKIKEIGEKSRRDIEAHLEMPIFLELFVKVREKWRNDKNLLKSYGY